MSGHWFANNGNNNQDDEERNPNEDIIQQNMAQFQAHNQQIRRLVAYLMCLVAQVCYLVNPSSRPNTVHKPMEPCAEDRLAVRQELLNHLTKNNRCRDIVRMGPTPFARLCDLLRRTHRLNDTKNIVIEEQVARFLHIISQRETNRSEQLFFRRSGETVNRQFHNVLKAIISLEDVFLKQPTGAEVSPQILNSSRFNPYFKDCIGAIDGTHVRVRVPASDAARYCGRKNWPTQNVMATCSFDMKFTYVLSGWEGTASDSRIIKNALKREDGLVIPNGKYYLADGEFILKPYLLTPYRGVRYHLKEYSIRSPENQQELFNNRHASLRNVIERAFGVLKKRFPIIAGGSETHYPVDTMSLIIIACCILHNYLLIVDPDDGLVDEVDREFMENDPITDQGSDSHMEDGNGNLGTMLRDTIATEMWANYML